MIYGQENLTRRFDTLYKIILVLYMLAVLTVNWPIVHHRKLAIFTAQFSSKLASFAILFCFLNGDGIT